MRTVRIVSGLYLLAFVTSHLLNLSLGLISIRAMDAARPYLSGFWTGDFSGPVLGLMLLVHYLIGLWAIFRKPVLNGTTQDMLQVLTGVFVIPLMATHVIGVAMLGDVGVHLDYQAINRLFWLSNPEIGLLQVILVSVVWVHGCAGLFTWLRSKSKAATVLPWLYPLAVAVPVFALLGYVQAGRAVLIEAHTPQVSAEPSPQTGYPSATDSYTTDAPETAPEYEAELAQAAIPSPEIPYALIKRVTSLTIWWSLGLAVLVFLARSLRLWLSSASRVRVTRGDAALVEASSGVTLLDALRTSDQPHASLCSGRGRCGTCAVRVVSLDISLQEPTALERATLDRIGCGPDVRLACQLRLMGGGAIAVDALYPADYTFGEALPEYDETDSTAEVTI
jgi:adenylate cyclase